MTLTSTAPPSTTPSAPAAPSPADVLALLRVGLVRVRSAWDYVPHGDGIGDGCAYLIDRGRVCAIIALWCDPTTGRLTRDDDVATAAAVAALADQLPGGRNPLAVPSEQVIVFNDRQRDPGPVIGLYERAIAALERRVVG
jgi:hypothetical protein